MDELHDAEHTAAVSARRAARARQVLKWTEQEEKLVTAQKEAQTKRWLELEEKKRRASERTGAPSSTAVANHLKNDAGLRPSPPPASGGGGCCGGGAAEVVETKAATPVDNVVLVPPRSAFPAPAHLDSDQGGNPLLELVDGFAWMPLKIAKRRAELLEALAASGAFDNVQVNDIIAKVRVVTIECHRPPPIAPGCHSMPFGWF